MCGVVHTLFHACTRHACCASVPFSPLPSIWAPQEEDFLDLDFSDLNITEEDDLFLDEAVGHIEANLEDELVQEALRKVSLRG